MIELQRAHRSVRRREGWHAIEPFGEYVGDRASLCFAKDLA
ncbi:hypothetical protein [Cellulomonas sp.]